MPRAGVAERARRPARARRLMTQITRPGSHRPGTPPRSQCRGGPDRRAECVEPDRRSFAQHPNSGSNHSTRRYGPGSVCHCRHGIHGVMPMLVFASGQRGIQVESTSAGTRTATRPTINHDIRPAPPRGRCHARGPTRPARAAATTTGIWGRSSRTRPHLTPPGQ
jgi:hypothetical protein